ncbi:MAG: tetratricopeptide repeat protein [Lachnospiraceae bacterium]|jgi:tetratricopeptide (TPR) repeat protein|nr:tetratricopeptide repeat protein [Lachnospiraceae bacterium]
MQTVLECRQCGASLDIDGGEKLVYCQYCGSANAISYADRFGLYNRANQLRRLNEFDRAIGVYEDILSGDPHDAEAHYGIALCKYGIEYVDDPVTERKVPTCHRTRYTLMSQDVDFKKALEEADADTAQIYQQEAAQIDAILKRIRQLSSDQEKYDIFICYKEGDGMGGRTHTSVQAQKIYQKLENSGYKVFFARKTLEKKLGSEYEPIIFSALFSAKVMLTIGEKPEEFQGVWVRNEWMRFRERMEAGEECTLIPLYRNMSPEDLPQEFVSLQALDMGKIGFEQDLLDGLAKLINRENSFRGSAGEQASDSAGLRKRAYLFLEQGDFKNASAYFERALDNNPEDAEAYFGKLLLEMGCRQEGDLRNLMISISGRESYQLAVRFAKGALQEKYKGYASAIDEKLAAIRAKAKEEREERARKKEEELKAQRELRERRRKEEEERRKKRVKCILIILPFVIAAAVIVADLCFTISEKFYSTPYSEDEIEITEYDERFGRLFLADLNNYSYSDKCRYLYYRTGDQIKVRKMIDYSEFSVEMYEEEIDFNRVRFLNGAEFLCSVEDWDMSYDRILNSTYVMDYPDIELSVKVFSVDNEIYTNFYRMKDGEYYYIISANKAGHKYLTKLRERAIEESRELGFEESENTKVEVVPAE